MTLFARAVAEIVLIFGIPLAAVAGGYAMRRKYRPDGSGGGSNGLYWLGNLMMAGGILFLAALGAIMLMMKHW